MESTNRLLLAEVAKEFGVRMVVKVLLKSPLIRNCDGRFKLQSVRIGPDPLSVRAVLVVGDRIASQICYFSGIRRRALVWLTHKPPTGRRIEPA